MGDEELGYLLGGDGEVGYLDKPAPASAVVANTANKLHRPAQKKTEKTVEKVREGHESIETAPQDGNKVTLFWGEEDEGVEVSWRMTRRMVGNKWQAYGKWVRLGGGMDIPENPKSWRRG